MHWLYLFIAIICEVIGTSQIALSEGFTRHWVAALGISLIAVSFFLLSLALKVIPVGIAYAIWSGTGIVLLALFGFVFLKQSLDMAAMIGIGLILSGVLVLNLFSNSTGH